MSDSSLNIDSETELKQTFKSYIEAFNTKKAANLLPFLYFPSLLADRDKEPVDLGSGVIGQLKARIGFTKVFKQLEKQGFDYSNLDAEPNVKQLRANLANLTGNATRYKTDKTVLERFGYTYTFRKTPDGWKIIAGLIHDPESH